ncbi:MAG TPA: hypothetical protein VHW01_08180, partial [Polyangiaceae bacterium]|nr:hypothetical protein [Polyangiaceae bacterium]
HCAAMPAQAAHVQPLSVHKTLVMLVEQASGVPEHEPALPVELESLPEPPQLKLRESARD